MINKDVLKRVAQERLDLAKRLLPSDPSFAVYIGGYAVEITLKNVICDHLGVSHFPDTTDAKYYSEPGTKWDDRITEVFKTHNLRTLLYFTGKDATISTDQGASFALQRVEKLWLRDELRYGTKQLTSNEAQEFMDQVEVLLRYFQVI